MLRSLSRLSLSTLSLPVIVALATIPAPALVAEEVSPAEYANDTFENALSDEKLLEALRHGGHAIYFRHASTEKDYADQVTADVNDGSTQRVLSEAGWHEAKAIGEAFRALGIPHDRVVSSQYFRAWQTADLAFGSYEKEAALNFLPFEDYTEAQFADMRKRVLPVLTRQPAAGTNAIYVAHDDPFEAVTGIYPAPQGVAYVLQIGENDVTPIARITPEHWTKLAKHHGKHASHHEGHGHKHAH